MCSQLLNINWQHISRILFCRKTCFFAHRMFHMKHSMGLQTIFLTKKGCKSVGAYHVDWFTMFHVKHCKFL